MSISKNDNQAFAPTCPSNRFCPNHEYNTEGLFSHQLNTSIQCTPHIDYPDLFKMCNGCANGQIPKLSSPLNYSPANVGTSYFEDTVEQKFTNTRGVPIQPFELENRKATNPDERRKPEVETKKEQFKRANGRANTRGGNREKFGPNKKNNRIKEAYGSYYSNYGNYDGYYGDYYGYTRCCPCDTTDDSDLIPVQTGVNSGTETFKPTGGRVTQKDRRSVKEKFQAAQQAKRRAEAFKRRQQQKEKFGDSRGDFTSQLTPYHGMSSAGQTNVRLTGLYPENTELHEDTKIVKPTQKGRPEPKKTVETFVKKVKESFECPENRPISISVVIVCLVLMTCFAAFVVYTQKQRGNGLKSFDEPQKSKNYGSEAIWF